MTSPYKAVIFDLGGVLLRTVDSKPRQQMAELFGTTMGELENFVFLGPTSLQSEVGALSDVEHWMAVLNRYGQRHLSVKEAYRQFFSGDGINQELMEYAYRLKPDYQIALLSNAWTNTRQNLTKSFDFINQFDVSIFSAEVGVRKPEKEIFYIMLQRLGVEPFEAIFIDDMPINVDAAQSIGMKAIQFTETHKTIQKLDKLLEKNK